MNTAQHQNRPDYSAHFLTRLDRLADEQLVVAKFLFEHPDCVRLLLRRVEIPVDCLRVVVQLSDRVDGPKVVLTRDGALVTVLAEKMVCNPHGAMVVGHDVLLDAMVEHDIQHVLAWVVPHLEPHAARIAKAHDQGEVAVVFLDVVPAAANAARSLGWGGGPSECVPLNRTRAERLAASLAPYGAARGPELDAARTSAWLRGRRPGRVFVCVEAAALCLNFTPTSTFTVEPGTVDGLVYRPTAAKLARRYVGRALARRTS
jgi:hypothetical protein